MSDGAERVDLARERTPGEKIQFFFNERGKKEKTDEKTEIQLNVHKGLYSRSYHV